MKILFLSNYFNHHQSALSRELHILDASYGFVSTSEMREERKKLGYGEADTPPYVHRYDDHPVETGSAILGCDAVIYGGAPYSLLRHRIRENKLIFLYSERPFKKNSNRLYPAKRAFRRAQWHIRYPRRKPIYLLCAGAYTAADYARTHLFDMKAYKWGYFPETLRYDTQKLFAAKDPTHILWCGRFLPWKHPDDALRAAQKLRQDGIRFTLDFIGTGDLEEQLKQAVLSAGLEDCVHFLGSMKPEEVRAHMERAGIFLFTSDRQEGWGAVLNESMNSGCAVIASHSIGAVPYLLKNGENGLIYRSGDTEALYEKIKFLLQNPHRQRHMGEAAYRTITECWNAETAAKRFVCLAQSILNGDSSPDLYESGPCSRAQILKDDWFHE